MKLSEIKSCYLGPELSPEQFVPEHFFLFLVKGKIEGVYADHHYQLCAGEACFVCKNQLIRYSKQPQDGAFEKVVIVLDSAFLKEFQLQYGFPSNRCSLDTALIPVNVDEKLTIFLHSLEAYYQRDGKLEAQFANLKRQELLLLLLQQQPVLATVLFNFDDPGRIDLRTFMLQHYKFNVSLERFAFLSGRSLSSFKRDFAKTFGQPPSSWLLQKRLEEAHFLLQEQQKRASEIYLELGFEDLSHFSYAFKKRFGYPPSHLARS